LYPGSGELDWSIDFRLSNNTHSYIEFGHADNIATDVGGYYVAIGANGAFGSQNLYLDSYDDSQVTVQNVGWLADTWYTLRVRARGNSVSVKAWARDAASEPSGWHASRFINSVALWTPGEVYIAFNSALGSPVNASYDIANFRTCPDVLGGDGVPDSGPYCEVLANSVGGTEFATSKAWYPGSLKVYINGLLLTNYTSDPALGEISLTAPISPSDVIYVCYQANGSPG
jgi:hypothetical protein